MNWISINGDDACKNDEYHSKKKRQNLGNFPVIELIPLTPDVHKKVIHTYANLQVKAAGLRMYDLFVDTKR